METLEEWLGWFSDDDLVRYPALAVTGAWLRVLDGPPRRGRALAGAGRRRDLGDRAPRAIEPWVANLRACMMPAWVEPALADARSGAGRADAAEPLAARGPAGPRRGPRAPRRHRRCGPGLRCRDRDGAGQRRGGRGVRRPRRAGAGGRAPRATGSKRRPRARAAQALVERDRARRLLPPARSRTWPARASRSTRDGRTTRARRSTRAHRLRPLLDHGIPWLTVQVGLELTRAHLALADAVAARTVLRETKRVLALAPRPGRRWSTEAAELSEHVQATSGSAGAWAMSLTGAELRLLPYLATYLTFPEVAEQPVHLPQHRQDGGGLDLPQAGRVLAQRGDRARGGGGPAGQLGVSPGAESHPGWMTRLVRVCGQM